MPSAKTYDAIIRDIKAKKFRPIYVLMGEEAYYIDLLQKAIMENALQEEDRDFCLNVFYGADTSANEVINAARSFPMGERLLVVVRGAGELKDIDELSFYLSNPQPTTILLVVNKGGKFDRRKKFMTLAEKIGVVFESNKVKDTLLPSFVSTFFQTKGYSIDNKSVSLVVESIGNDLTKLYAEMNKLANTLGDQQRNITPEIIEQHIGISKDFNVFEFQDALIYKNSFKAFQIAKYFYESPKQHPIGKVLPVIFKFFSTLLSTYYCPAKDENSMAEYLGMTPWQLRRNIMPALRNYPAAKIMSVLLAIKDADEKSKGIGGCKLSEGEILKQLIFFILH